MNWTELVLVGNLTFPWSKARGQNLYKCCLPKYSFSHKNSENKLLNKSLETFFRDEFLTWLKLFYTVILHISVNLRLCSLQWDQNDKNWFLHGGVTLNWILAGLKEKVTNFNICTQFSPLCRVTLLKRIKFALNQSLWIKTCQRVFQVVWHGWMHTSFKVVVHYLIMPRVSDVERARAIGQIEANNIPESSCSIFKVHVSPSAVSKWKTNYLLCKWCERLG